MADVAMGNLRFDLTADNSQFMAAVKQAKEAQTQAASEMGSKFAEASKKAEEATTSMLDKIGTKAFDTIKTLQTLGKSVGEAFAGGADAAEKLTNDLFKRVMANTEGAVRKWVNSIPGGIGKFVTATFDLLDSSGAIGKGWEVIGKVTAALGDKALEKIDTSKLTKGLRDGIVTASSSTNEALGAFFDKNTIDEQQKNIAVFADNVQGKLDEMIEGARTALQKIAETWQGVREEVQKAVGLSDARTRSTEFQTSTMGMATGEKAAAVERQRMLADIGKAYSELNKAEKEELATREKAAAMAAIDQQARRSGIDAAKQYDDALTAIKKKNAELTMQGNFLGATTGEKTEATELAKIIDKLGDSWGRLTEAKKREYVEEARMAGLKAQAIEDQQKATQEAKSYEQAITGLTAALRRQAEMTMANAGRGMGKTAAERSLEQSDAMARDYGQGRNQGLVEDPRYKAEREAKAASDQLAANRGYAMEMQRTIKEQTAGFDLQTASLGKTVGEAERMRFAQEQLNKAEREGVVVNDALRAKIDASARAFGGSAQARADAAFRYDLERSTREAGARGAFETDALGKSAGEVERLRVEMELTNKAKSAGITLDAQAIEMNRANAQAMGMIAQATAEAKERYEALREVGRTVASSLEEAFGKFMNGTRVGWKEFIADLEKDLARLAFKKGIEGILTGTATGGGGLFGALAGLISGARAEGGPVSAGGRYIVGERGPEMFVPQSAGSIVPNHAMGGGSGATTINMRIDLAGANGDETIARISAQAARQAAMQAVQASNDAFPQRQRSLQLLGA